MHKTNPYHTVSMHKLCTVPSAHAGELEGQYGWPFCLGASLECYMDTRDMCGGPVNHLQSMILWSYCVMSYGLMSYGHTVICPMVLEFYVLWSYVLWSCVLWSYCPMV